MVIPPHRIVTLAFLRRLTATDAAAEAEEPSPPQPQWCHKKKGNKASSRGSWMERPALFFFLSSFQLHRRINRKLLLLLFFFLLVMAAGLESSELKGGGREKVEEVK